MRGDRSKSRDPLARVAQLPPDITRCFTKDGRVFYANERERTTTWIHPQTGEPMGTGFFQRRDLPIGWEQAITPEGAIYFINHNNRTTTFNHPTSGVPAANTSIFKLISSSSASLSATVNYQEPLSPTHRNQYQLRSPHEEDRFHTSHDQQQKPVAVGNKQLRGSYSHNNEKLSRNSTAQPDFDDQQYFHTREQQSPTFRQGNNNREPSQQHFSENPPRPQSQTGAKRSSYSGDVRPSRSRPDNLHLDNSHHPSNPVRDSDSGYLESSRGFPEDRHSLAINPSQSGASFASRNPDPRRAQSQFDLTRVSDSQEPEFTAAAGHHRERSFTNERDAELSSSKHRGLSLQDLRLAGRSQSVETLLRQQEQSHNAGFGLKGKDTRQNDYRSQTNVHELDRIHSQSGMNVSDVGNYDPVSGLPIVKNPSGKVLQGWLERDERKGIRNIKSSWHDRWCVISGKQLVVCKSADSNAKRAVFELIGYQVTPTPHDDILNAREERHTFKLEKDGEKTLYFGAQSQEARSRWVYALRMAAQPLAEPRPFVLQQHHFQNRGSGLFGNNKENRSPIDYNGGLDQEPVRLADAKAVPLLMSPSGPDNWGVDGGGVDGQIVAAESEPQVDQVVDTRGRPIERTVLYREYIDPVEKTRESVKREREHSQTRTRQQRLSEHYKESENPSLHRGAATSVGPDDTNRSRVPPYLTSTGGSPNEEHGSNRSTPKRSRSSAKKNKRDVTNVLQPKDQAYLPGNEEERLQEERDLHIYRKLQLDRTFSREEFYRRGQGMRGNDHSPKELQPSRDSIASLNSNQQPMRVEEDDVIAAPRREAVVESALPEPEVVKPKVPRDQVVDELVLFLSDVRNDYAILELRRDEMISKLQKKHDGLHIAMAEYLQHEQMVNKRVIVTISDDVELHRKRGDIDASNEAFQRLITMSQEVVHSSNGAVKTLQNPADSSFKDGLKELLLIDTECQTKCFDILDSKASPGDLAALKEDSTKCLEDCEVLIEDAISVREQDTATFLAEAVDIQLLFERIKVQRQRLLLDVDVWLVKLKNPEFTLQLKDLNVQQGEQIEFTCKLQMHPNFNMGRTEHIKIEWQINDLRIVDTPQTRVLMEPDGTNRLIVPDADVGDSGTFHCIATNILTGHSEVTSCKLKVIPNEPEGEPPIILAELVNQTSTFGSQFRAVCKISGEPEPAVFWFIEGRQLKDGIDGCKTIQRNGVCELIIDNVGSEHSGRLAVEAENKFGKAQSMCYLSVQEPKEDTNSFGVRNGLRSSNQSNRYKLEEYEETVSVYQNVGSNLNQMPRYANSETNLTYNKTEFPSDYQGSMRNIAETDLDSQSVTSLNEKNSSRKVFQQRREELNDDALLRNVHYEPRDTDKALSHQDLRMNGSKMNRGSVRNPAVIPKSEIVEEEVEMTMREKPPESQPFDLTKIGPAITEAPQNSKPDPRSLYRVPDENEKYREYNYRPENERSVKREMPIAQAPRMVSQLSRVAVVSGDEIELRCIIEAYPPPRVQWFKDSKLLTPSDRITMSEDGPEKVLTIDDVDDGDQGVYVCKADNAQGTIQTSATLQVFQAPRPEPPKNYTSSQEETENKQKQPNSHTVREDSFNGTTMSSYNSTTTQHQYETLGSHTSQANQKPYIMHQVYEPHNPLSSHMDPPFVVDQLKSTVVEEGRTANFRVRVIGRPQPKVVWLKDESQIDFNKERPSRLTHEMNGDVYKLTIKNVTQGDRGIYAISAENDFGKALNSADLDVTSGKSLSTNPGAPKLLMGLSDSELVVGQNALLKCVIHGNPTPRVTWYKDNLEIMVTPRHKIYHKGNEFSLRIEQFSSVDEGVYKCEAANQHGALSSSALLALARDSKDRRYLLAPASNVFAGTTTTVTEETSEMYARCNSTEEQTKVVERLKGKMIHEGQPLALSCRIHVTPEPVSFYWEKDGVLLEKDSERGIIIAGKNDYQSLYIPSVTMENAGIYRCTGENAIGSKAVTAAEIIVKPDLSSTSGVYLNPPLSSRESSYSRLYRPNSQVSLRSAHSSMHNLYQAPPTALVSGHDIGTNGGSRRFGSQEALSIAEEDEDRDSNADGEYITKSTVKTTNKSVHESMVMHQSGKGSASSSSMPISRLRPEDSRSTASLYSAVSQPQYGQLFNPRGSSEALHRRSTSAISTVSNKSYGGTDPTEADIDKMEQLILNKQTPQLSSTAQLSASNGLRGTAAGMGSKGGSTRGSLVDLKGSSARLMPDDNDASPGADLMDIDKQVLMPQKVVIPERYYDARAANPQENTIERKERQVKTENVRKMVLSQALTESSSVASFEERASLVEQQAKIGQLASKFGQHIAYQRPLQQNATYSATNRTGQGNNSVPLSQQMPPYGVHRA
ncbi:uncharacterized protein LOC142344413 isoform X2 [Convolutriloba macropyga]|uniref:uncharacterized protein LOC142344413 isoform X2 n=1 Tax=Convolutriloba macropyga TaxID=536237 RepID=UPI003F51EB75